MADPVLDAEQAPAEATSYSDFELPMAPLVKLVKAKAPGPS